MHDGLNHAVQLQAEDDVAGFRNAARRLLAQGVAPEHIQWQVATAQEADLFGSLFDQTVPEAPADEAPPSLTLPPAMLASCERALLHADPHRFAKVYRLLWRLMREPYLRHDPLDPFRVQVEQMAHAVRREMHKMTAFVRFRPLGKPTDDEWRITHVAWFEPEHHIAAATAPFFANRFAQMRWAILTPERSVRWNGQELSFGPGARREDAPPADAGERLWLTYYESIFNPARVKLKAVQKEMPRRYWKNLPEATLIQPLAARAAERSGRMVESGGSEPTKRRPASSIALRLDQRPITLFTPDTLEELRQATDRCRDCPIGQCATQAVHGEGPAGAKLMIVGEQPGDQEDLHGRPFVGPAGQLLDRALAQLGLPREQLYVTNAVKHFKYELRGKRRVHKTPAQQEIMACSQWLEEEIALVKPQTAIALGATAAQTLLGRPVGVNAERGRWFKRPDGLKVLITLHPAALLRMDPGAFEAAFEAWLADLDHACGEVFLQFALETEAHLA